MQSFTGFEDACPYYADVENPNSASEETFSSDSPALAASSCSTDTNRATSGLTGNTFQAASCCQNSKDTKKSTTGVNFISDKKKKAKGKVSHWDVAQFVAGSYT